MALQLDEIDTVGSCSMGDGLTGYLASCTANSCLSADWHDYQLALVMLQQVGKIQLE